MRGLKIYHLILFMSLVAGKAFAVNLGAQTFTLDGRLFSDTALTVPLSDPNVLVDIKVLDPSKNCVLYEEHQSVNTTSSNGYFTLQVGSNMSDGKRTGADPNNPMATVFQNQGAPLVGGCGSYTPASGDVRYVRITVTPSSTGVPDTFSPDMTMNAAPSAMVAESLQGLNRSQVLELGTVTNLTQANEENVFSNTNYPKLTSLLAGTSSQYVSTSSNGAAVPGLASNPTSPVAGDLWYDSTNNLLKFYNGTGVQTVGTGGGTVTSVGSGTGLTGGPITGSGTLAVNVGTVAGQIVQVQTGGKLPALDGSNLTNISGGAISSGTIGGSASVSTTGSIVAASSSTTTDSTHSLQLFNTGNTQEVTVAAPAGLAASYSLTLPNALPGTAGYVLSTDTSGNLSWVAPGVANAYVDGGNTFGSAATLGTTDNYSLTVITNNSPAMTVLADGNVGIGTTTPGALLHVYQAGNTNTEVNIGVKGTGNAEEANLNFMTSGGGAGTLNTAGTQGIQVQATGASTTYPNNLNFNFYNGTTLSTIFKLANNQAEFSVPVGVQFNNTGATYSSASTTANFPSGPVGFSNGSWSGDNSASYFSFSVLNSTPHAQLGYIGAYATPGATYAPTLVFGQQTGANAYNERMRIDSSGNVGVGTTSPGGNLAVDNAGHNATLCLNGNCVTSLGSSGGLPEGGGTMTGGLVGDNGTSVTPSFAFTGDATTGFYDNGAHGIAITNNGVESMAFTSTGIAGTGAITVSAGGTNQALTLDSSGTAAVNIGTGNGTALSVLDDGAATADYVTVQGSAAGGSPVIATAGSDTNINLSITPKGTGNVGIGTTSPLATLHVAGTVRADGDIGIYEYVNGNLYSPTAIPYLPAIRVNDTGTAIGTGSMIDLSVNAAGVHSYIGAFSNATGYNPAIFFMQQTGAATYAERMRIDQTGYVGIGATTPLYPLQVTGTANATTFLMNGSASAEAAKVTNAAEAVNVSATAAASTVNFYVASGAVMYYTANASANFTLNWAWSPGTALNTAMAIGDSITTVFLVTQGTTAYYPTAFEIDGTTVTPKWQGGAAPSSGDASSIDAYTCTIIKTSSAVYTVLCAATQYQ